MSFNVRVKSVDVSEVYLAGSVLPDEGDVPYLHMDASEVLIERSVCVVSAASGADGVNETIVGGVEST